MSSASNPRPSLIAILLVIRSRAGSQFVFHYPPKPNIASGRKGRRASDDSLESEGSITEDSFSDDAASEGRSWDSESDETAIDSAILDNQPSKRGIKSPAAPRKEPHQARQRVAENEAEDLSSASDSERQRVRLRGPKRSLPKDGRLRFEWEEILGLSTDSIEKLLAPPRAFHKKRFEVEVNDLAFVGCPQFIREDGRWRKSERRGNGDEDGNAVDNDNAFDANHDHEDPIGKMPQSVLHQQPTTGKEPPLTMFNVVLVIDTLSGDASTEISEMYDHVARRLAKSLKVEQSRSKYVRHQCKTILGLKDRAKESHTTQISSLWAEIIGSSSLAKGLSHAFHCINNGEIASFRWTGETDVVLQMPQRLTTSSHKPLEQPLMGTWLTTAREASSEAQTRPDAHSALLLLNDEETVFEELQRYTHDLHPTLAYYIRNSTPTKSLKKISIKLGVPLPRLQMWARHLIYYRQARLIPPLNARDTYILSPTTDLSRVKAAKTIFSARFPRMPPLEMMLQSFSGAETPFRSHIPAKDLRPMYMAALAWLLRGGWVTQLRTFAWIQISPTFQHAVALNLLHARSKPDKDGQTKLSRHRQSGGGKFEIIEVDGSRNQPGASEHGPSKPLTEQNLRATSMQSRSHHLPPRPSSASDSVRSVQTTVPLRDSALATARQQEPQLQDFRPILIADPGDENPFIAGCLKALTEALLVEDRGLRDIWMRIVPYLNGRHALEDVSGKEGLKRLDLFAAVERLVESGRLVTVKHW